MKKLMTMIATVAMAFGLYATDTLNNSVDFSTYTDVNPWLLTGSDGSTPDTLWAWTGAATAPETDEAEIKSGALVLATGSNVLSRKFAAETVEANENLYVDMQLNFNGEALDAIPTDADVNGAKLVVFALNTTEWDTPAAGQTLPEGTNFFVMASYGSPAEKALFQINGFDGTTLNDRRLAIKAYKNVVTGGGRGGFLLYISHSGDTGIVPVDVAKVYLFDDNDNIVWTDVMGDNYLGREDIVGNLSKWIGQKSLFVSLDGNPDTYDKFTSVDLKGRAALSSITLSDDSTEWPLDAVSMPLVKSEDVTIELTQESKDAGFVVNADSISAPAAGDFGFTVETEKGEVTVKYGDNEIKPDEDGVYTATLTPGTTALTITGWDVAATVKIGEGDEEKCATIAEAIEKASDTDAAAKITLAKDVESDNNLIFLNENEIVLDLAGQTITLTSGSCIDNEGLLIITDSVGGGKVEGIIENYATLTINAGIFDGEVYNDVAADALTITGGAFDKTNNSTEDGKAFKFDVGPDYEAVDGTGELDGFWVVQEKQVTNFIIEIVGGDKYESIADALAAAKNNDTLKLLKDITLDDTLVVNKAITLDLDNCVITLAADKAIGIDIKVDGVTITNGEIDSALTANVAYSKAINIPNKNVTLNDVEINAGHYEYAIYANCDDDCKAAGDKLEWFYDDITRAKFATLNCELVNINGNGSLFHIEGMTANLTSCVAAYDNNPLFANEAHRAAVYSAVNALTTISGAGSYTHVNALQSGNLGGKITVKSDSTAKFTGDIKSWMKVGAHPELEKTAGYAALFNLLGGIYDGDIVFEDDNARNLDLFTKGNDVTLNPPEGYKWDEGVLTKIEYATLTITKGENVTAVVVTNALGEVVTEATKFDKDDAVVVAVDLSQTTFAENYELDAAESTLTVTLSADAEIIVKAKEKQQGWPDNPQDVKGQSAGVALGITGKLAGADACELSTWAKDFNVTFNVDVDQYENAFLLNCDPAEVEDAEKAFKFTAITPGETPTTTKQYKGRNYNGTVQITAYEDVGFTKPVDNPTGAEAELFYKAELILVPVNK